MSRIWSLLLGLLFVVLQITLANLLSIFSVKPDLIVIFVVVRALRDGSTAGVVWGFGLGLLLDAVSGGLLGLGSLSYSVAGFISGQLSGGKIVSRLQYLMALALSALAAHAILLYFSTPWEETGILPPLVQQCAPGVIYSFCLGLVWMISPFSHSSVEKKHG